LRAGLVLAFLLLLALLVTWVHLTWGPLLEFRNQAAVELLLLGLLGISTLVMGAAALVKGPIRTKEITERTILLTGVADNFPGAEAPRPWWKPRTCAADEALTTDHSKQKQEKVAGPSLMLVFGAAMIFLGSYFLAEGKITFRGGPPIKGPAVTVIGVAQLGIGGVLFFAALRRRKK